MFTDEFLEKNFSPGNAEDSNWMPVNGSPCVSRSLRGNKGGKSLCRRINHIIHR